MFHKTPFPMGRVFQVLLLHLPFAWALSTSLCLLLFHTAIDPIPLPGSPVRVEGTVCSFPRETEDVISFDLCPNQVKTPSGPLEFQHRILVTTSRDPQSTDRTPEIRDRLAIRSRLREPTFYLVPTITDYRWRAYRQGSPYRIRLKSPLQIRYLDVPPSLYDRFIRRISLYRKGFRIWCLENLREDSAQLLQATVLGERRALTPEEQALWSRLGVAHLLVVSGYHIGLLALLLYALCRPFSKLQGLLAITLTWLYLVVIGFPYPALRAGLVLTLFLLFRRLGLRQNLANTLGIAALAILGPRIDAVFDSSFQFSFVCLLGIVTISIPLCREIDFIFRAPGDLFSHQVLWTQDDWKARLRRRLRYQIEFILQTAEKSRLPAILSLASQPLRYFLLLLLFSAGIQVLLLPLIFAQSIRWNFFSPLYNAVISPLFLVLVPLGYLLFLGFATPLAALLSPFYDGLVTILGEMILACNQFDSLLHLRNWHAKEALLYLSLVFLFALAPFPRRLILLLIPPLFLAGILLMPRQEASKGLEIHFLDVGQGDAIHVRYPDGSYGLIDTGGSRFLLENRRIGEQVLSRYLLNRHVRELEYLLVTHPEQDHRGAYPWLAEAVSIHRTLAFALEPDYPSPLVRLSQGVRFVHAGVHHTTISPPPHTGDRTKANESSLVILLRFGRFSALLTGDIGGRTEQKLLTEIEPVFLLKLAHHGSKYSNSSPWLKRLQPLVAVVSAGRRNPFGHPSQEVIGRLSSLETTLFSTAEQGTLQVTTDGTNWVLRGYAPDRQSLHATVRQESWRILKSGRLKCSRSKR